MQISNKTKGLCFVTLVALCRHTIPLLLGLAEALGAASVHGCNLAVISELLFPKNLSEVGYNNTLTQMPLILHKHQQKRYVRNKAIPPNEERRTVHLTNEQLELVIAQVQIIWLYLGFSNDSYVN